MVFKQMTMTQESAPLNRCAIVKAMQEVGKGCLPLRTQNRRYKSHTVGDLKKHVSPQKASTVSMDMVDAFVCNSRLRTSEKHEQEGNTWFSHYKTEAIVLCH